MTQATQTTHSAPTQPVQPEKTAKPDTRNEWRVVPTLLPFLWEYKWRVVVALIFLVTAKLANVGVPLLMKAIVDDLTPTQQVLAVPFMLLIAYGVLRLDRKSVV